MAIYIGTLQPTDIYLGEQKIQEIYLDTDRVFQTNTPTQTYTLTIIDNSSGVVKVYINYTQTGAGIYVVNNGAKVTMSSAGTPHLRVNGIERGLPWWDADSNATITLTYDPGNFQGYCDIVTS